MGRVEVAGKASSATVGAVRPARPNGHGAAWETVLGREDQIRGWLKGMRVSPVLDREDRGAVGPLGVLSAR
jgi:hypothetical protein